MTKQKLFALLADVPDDAEIRMFDDERFCYWPLTEKISLMPAWADKHGDLKTYAPKGGREKDRNVWVLGDVPDYGDEE